MTTIVTDYCNRCKVTGVPLIKNSLYTRKDGREVQQHQCRPCNNARAKRYYANNKERYTAIVKKSEEKYPEKKRAREKLNYAVHCGVIEKPKDCPVCGVQGVRIEGHHTDYSKPLEVQWTCSGCHADAHKREREYT